MNKNLHRLEQEIIQQLKVLDDFPPRSEEAVKNGRSAFLSKAENMKLGISKSEKLRHNYRKDNNTGFLFRKERFKMPAFVSALLIVVLLLGGTGGTVFAAQSSLPDELLYPIKTLSEDLRLNLTTDPLSKVDLLQELISRRMVEIDAMIQNGDELPQEVLNRLQMQLDMALRTISRLQNEEVISRLLRLHEQLQAQERVMQQLQLSYQQTDGQLEQAREMIQNRIMVIESGLEDPQTIRERLNNPNQDVPDMTPGTLDQEQQQNVDQGNGMDTQGPESRNDGEGGQLGEAGTEEDSNADGNFQQQGTPAGPSGVQGEQKNPEHTPALDGQGSQESSGQSGQDFQPTRETQMPNINNANGQTNKDNGSGNGKGK